jgi:hypothetical protein
MYCTSVMASFFEMNLLPSSLVAGGIVGMYSVLRRCFSEFGLSLMPRSGCEKVRLCCVYVDTIRYPDVMPWSLFSKLDFSSVPYTYPKEHE